MVEKIAQSAVKLHNNVTWINTV